MQPLPADCKTVTLLMIDQYNLSAHLIVLSSVFAVLCMIINSFVSVRTYTLVLQRFTAYQAASK